MKYPSTTPTPPSQPGTRPRRRSERPKPPIAAKVNNRKRRDAAKAVKAEVREGAINQATVRQGALLAAMDKTFKRYIENLGPREELLASLALVEDAKPRWTKFLEAAVAHPKLSLVVLAKRNGISMPEFNDFVRKRRYQEALDILTSGAARVAPDIVEDAKSRVAICEACDGMGVRIAGPLVQPVDVGDTENPMTVCPVCRGEGTVMEPGDAEARKMVMTASGIIKNGGGVNINNNVQTVGGGFGLGAMVRSVEMMMGKQLEQGREPLKLTGDGIIDAEPVDATSAAGE